VFTNGRDSRLLRLGAGGEVLVDAQLPEPAVTRPQIDSRGRIAVGGRQAVHALKADGAVAWSRPNGLEFVELLGRSDDTLLAMNFSSVYEKPPIFTSLDADGHVLWRRELAEPARAMPATGPGGETML